MTEVEIFLRFSEISVETTKRDLLQALGVSTSSVTWRDVVVKLLSNEAHVSLQRRVQYVGERIRWFFERQKDVVRHLIYQAFDAACKRQLQQFTELFDNLLTS